MSSICFHRISKFLSIVCLNDFRLITEINNGSFNKIDGGIRRLFLVRIDKSFTRSFINDSVLIELLPIVARITIFRYIFHIHLPFNTNVGRCIILFWSISFFLFFIHINPHFTKNSKKRRSISGVAFFHS